MWLLRQCFGESERSLQLQLDFHHIYSTHAACPALSSHAACCKRSAAYAISVIWAGSSRADVDVQQVYISGIYAKGRLSSCGFCHFLQNTCGDGKGKTVLQKVIHAMMRTHGINCIALWKHRKVLSLITGTAFNAFFLNALYVLIVLYLYILSYPKELALTFNRNYWILCFMLFLVVKIE